MAMNPRLLRPTRTASAGSDPYFSSVSLLLHMDGANESTTFTDSSSSAATLTAFGSAEISTAQSKFGGASGLFPPDGGVTVPASAATFGSDDFTIECWFYLLSQGFDSSGANFNFFFTGHSGSDATGFSLYTGDGQLNFLASSNIGWGLLLLSGQSPSLNEWHHAAVCRQGNDFALYLDGASVATSTFSNGIATPTDVAVGFYAKTNNSTAISCDGYIDELRVTKGAGSARYTAAFTPPTAPFPSG